MRDHVSSKMSVGSGYRPMSSGFRSVCSVTSAHSTPLLLQRHRTLDDYPMQHGLADAVRMLERRRQEQQAHKRQMASELSESRNLNSYSRRRFETALGTRRGEKLPAPSDTDQSLFWREPRPLWTRPRHHSVSGGPLVGKKEEPIKLAERPDSEPPLRTCLPGRTFNHTRGNPETYPGIRQLVREYNTELRVVCASPGGGERSCAAAWQSGRSSVLSDVLLVPLQEDLPEDQEEEEEEAESVESFLSLAEGEEEDEDGERGVDGGIDGADGSPRAERLSGEKTGEPDTAKSRGKRTKAAPPAPEDPPPDDDVESVGSAPSPSPPWRCWVDDATVSSISAPSEAEGAAEDGFSPAPSPALDMPGQTTTPGSKSPAKQSGDAAAAAALKTPNRLDAKTAKSPIEKPPSPSPAETPAGRKKSSAKGKRKKEPEPVELPEPPPVEEMKEEAEVEEVTVEVVEEVEPVLPLSICPSSEVKSHQAEVKLWLRKSPFSAAGRSVPVYWS